MQTVSAGAEVGVGTVLGSTYEITALIGKGGMGAVWAARHLRLPKRVAVKVLLGSVTADSDAFARFRREAEVASKLGHPNIVEVLDFDTLPSGAPYLVLELLEGESLATRLRRGALPLEKTLSVARQIASGLYAAHREGVVHRDLKPENVFLIPREVDGEVTDHVKILDFGISKIQGSQTIKTQEAMLLGTPQYMSPEQATGKNDLVDARTDQFALGVMLFEMFAGRAPFVGTNVAEVLFKVVYEPPPFLDELAPGLPEHVVDAVNRALQKKPEDRFADVSALIEALGARPLATIEKKIVKRAEAAEAFAETVDSGKRGVPVPARVTQAPLPAPTPAPLPSPTPSDPAAAAPRPARAPWLIGALVLVATAVGAYVILRKPTETPSTAESQAANSPADAAARPEEPEPPQPPVVPATSSDAATAPASTPDAAPLKKPKERPSPTPSPTPSASPVEEREEGGNLPAGVKQDLDDAEAALIGKDISTAERLANRTLYKKQTKRAQRILLIAACARRDMPAAHRWMRQFPPKAWPRLKQLCRQQGYEIENPPP